MLLRLRVIWGMLMNDLRAYVESYRTAVEWAKRYPDVNPSDFKALNDRAWEDLEKTVFGVQEESKQGAAPFSMLDLPSNEELN